MQSGARFNASNKFTHITGTFNALLVSYDVWIIFVSTDRKITYDDAANSTYRFTATRGNHKASKAELRRNTKESHRSFHRLVCRKEQTRCNQHKLSTSLLQGRLTHWSIYWVQQCRLQRNKLQMDEARRLLTRKSQSGSLSGANLEGEARAIP